MGDLERKFPNLYHLFRAFLHQDWSIEGDTLSAVFEQNVALQNLPKGIRTEAKCLLNRKYEDKYLDDIFFEQWGAGYEPEADGLEDWNAVLREIVRYTERYEENN